MTFANLNLHPALLRAVTSCGFSAPTEIQRQAIPVALEGRDLMASAQTGTGKTAAFVLPALQRLQAPARLRGHGPRVLVLTPTRELAQQVGNNIAQLGQFSRVRSGSVVGGEPYPSQIRMLSRPLDLLVATPGRLMDHMERSRVDLGRVELLVLDEADRMLDMGFIDAVKTIAEALPAARQTLLFSATLEGRVMEVSRRLLRDPARIQLAANHQRHAAITQRLHLADNLRHKQLLLDHFLDHPELEQAVIFTATKRSADQLADALVQGGHACAALHGDMGQRERRRTVEHMRRGHVRLLVATDVAARGLDIRGITHVINFDLPMVAEDYIHRIGRTGRAGATGTAVSLVGPADWRKLAGIERVLGCKLQRDIIPGLEPRLPEPRAGSTAGRSKGGARRGGAPSRGGTGLVREFGSKQGDPARRRAA